jgi:2-phospho-L-lactate guanylyltransferase
MPLPSVAMDGRHGPGARPTGGAERTVALVPVRHLERAKSRLGEALDAEERATLATALVARTLGALVELRARGSIEGLIVASGDPAVLSVAVRRGATPLPVPGADLVADLEAARELAVVVGATAVIVVPIDLATVSAAALGAVIDAAHAAASEARPETAIVALVPDRRGEGTNVLYVSPPRAIPFAFGPASRARHTAAAAAAGAAFVEVAGPLALDLDTPDDLAAADAATPPAGLL